MLGASNYPKEERPQPYRYAYDQPVEINPSAKEQTVAKPFEYRIPCRDPKGKDESDLCAQWKSANAAEDSAIWAKRGFWIAVIGSSLLLWQIALTRQAVGDTQQATKAMRKANRIAENAQRPRIAITVVPDSVMMIHKGKADLGIQVIAKNIGLKVATDLIVEAAMFVGSPKASERKAIVEDLRNKVRRHQSEPEYNRRTVLPSETAKSFLGVSCPPQDEIYRIIVYLEYRIDGTGPFKFCWSSFDLMTQVDGHPNTIDIAKTLPIPAKALVLDHNGVGEAD